MFGLSLYPHTAVSPPAGTPPAGTPPAGTPPAGTPPAGTPPAEGAPTVSQTPGDFNPQDRQVLDHLYLKYFGDDDNESYEDMLTRIVGARIGELETEAGQYGTLGEGVSTLRKGLENAPPIKFDIGGSKFGLKPSPERIAKLYSQESGYLDKQQETRDLMTSLSAEPRREALDYGLNLLKEEPNVTMHNPETGASMTGPIRIMPEGWELGTYPGITQTQQAQLNIQNAGLGVRRNQLDLQKEQFEYSAGTTWADVINILASGAVAGTNLITFGQEVWSFVKPVFDSNDVAKDIMDFDVSDLTSLDTDFYPVWIAPSVDYLPEGSIYLNWEEVYK